MKGQNMLFHENSAIAFPVGKRATIRLYYKHMLTHYVDQNDT